MNSKKQQKAAFDDRYELPFQLVKDHIRPSLFLEVVSDNETDSYDCDKLLEGGVAASCQKQSCDEAPSCLFIHVETA
jgi:hypothetical protein